MKRRYWLACLWLAFFAVGLIIVESYFWRKVMVAGQLTVIVTEASRLEVYKLLSAIYGPPLLMVGAAWFSKPLPPFTQDAVEAFRYRLALFATVGFNVIVLGLLAVYHARVGEGTLVESLGTARAVALLLDFVIAWPNVHYFGAKLPAETGG